MEKWKIIDDIEEIQNQVDEMGFAGSNEKELWTRDLIAEYIVKKLSLCGVGSSLISEEEFNTMANDYIKLECNNNEEFNIKAQRFQDYRNGLKNMHKVLK